MVQINNKGAFIFLTLIFPILIIAGCRDDGVSDETLKGYLEAKSIYIEGDLEKAESLFRVVTDTSPEFIQARFMLAKTHFFLGKPEEAKTMLTKLVNKNPDYKEAELFLIRILIQNDELDIAKNRIDRLLTLDSGDPRLLYQRAMIFQREEDITSALEYLKKAALFGEEYARVYLDLGRVYYVYQSDEHALRELGKCLVLLDDNSPLRHPVENLTERIIEEGGGQ